MDTILFFVVFSVLTLFYVILGIIAAKNVKTTDDYFLANRDLGLFSVTLTLIATQLGGAMLLGTSQNAYQYGLYGLLYTVSMAGGFLALSAGIASRLQSLNVATTAEIFESHYQAPILKKIASCLSVITLCGILIGQIVGSRSIMENIATGTHNEFIFIGFWLFVIIYTMVGGLKAVVITDIFQVLLIIAVFSSIFGYMIFFGPPFAWQSLPTLQKDYFGTMPLSLNMIIATLLMPALFALIEQDLAQRFFAARSRKIAAYSALLSGIGMILFATIPVYFGMQAKIMGIGLSADQSPLIAIIAYLTNNSVVIFSLCAIIAAITSTADSLLCAISSNIAQDFGWIGNQTSLRYSQWITLLTGLFALIASYGVPQNIITIMIESYTISVSCLLVPLLWAYFSPRVSKNAAIVSVIFGGIGIIIIHFWQTDLPKTLLPLLLSFLGYSITFWLSADTHRQ